MTNQPNKEAIMKWIAALESGEYKQGTGVLHRVIDDKHSYCCLGVACEIVKDELELPVVLASEDTDRYQYGKDGTTGYFPCEVLHHYDIAYNMQEELISMNDTGNKSFIEIAEFLRKTYGLEE